MEKEKFNWANWLVLNILVPAAPFIIKLFIFFTGNAQITSKIKIVETPELLYCSITVCVVALNINLEGKKKSLESSIRYFLQFITVADVLMLTLIYSGNEGANSAAFSVIFTVIPILISIAYQYNMLKRNGDTKGETENAA